LLFSGLFGEGVCYRVFHRGKEQVSFSTCIQNNFRKLLLNIDIEGIVVIVGNYGSGKSEVSINLAANRKLAGIDVRIADLDLVNPYFRTREAKQQLGELGIGVVLPPHQYHQADLPILSPTIAGLIRDPAQLTILDVGGDDAGATVLASLADAFEGRAFQVFQVVNPLRPYTGTLEGCMKIRDEIETASKLSITGIIGNANLIDETGLEDIYSGYEFVKQLADKSGLSLAFITMDEKLIPDADLEQFSCPVLSIYRQLVPPWKQAGKFS